jgi:hypothetical protein
MGRGAGVGSHVEEKRRGGGGRKFIAEYWVRVQLERSQRRQKTVLARLKTVLDEYRPSVRRELRGASGLSVRPEGEYSTVRSNTVWNAVEREKNLFYSTRARRRARACIFLLSLDAFRIRQPFAACDSQCVRPPLLLEWSTFRVLRLRIDGSSKPLHILVSWSSNVERQPCASQLHNIGTPCCKHHIRVAVRLRC